MKFQFIYWLSLIFVFNINIASELPFLHLSNQTAEQGVPSTYVRINQQEHSDVRQQLLHPRFNPYDYVYVQTSDGQKWPIHKTQIPDYQPQFELGMLNDYVAPSLGKRIFGHNYESSSQYFADDFAGNFPENVFHCVLNYQYPGFCKHAQSLKGFDGFILSMSDQLKSGSELQKRMERYWGGKDAFTVLQRINKAKTKERDDREWQAKRQVVRRMLQEREFDQRGMSLLEQYKITDQFTYHGNLVQIAQLKEIAHFFNDVAIFQQEVGKVTELQQIADHATGFGILANNANRENKTSFSQICLEIGQNILALGQGLKNGLKRNITGLYHLVRYPVDTIEGVSYLVKTIGTGIGKLALTLSKHDLGLELGDENLIRSAHQDVDNWVDGGRQLYEVAKQIWHDKSKLERYELTGNIASDFLLAKGLSRLGKLGSLKNLASYKPQAFSELGNIGREINQIAGLACAKGIEAVEAGFNIVESCPQILKLKSSTVSAIKHCNKKVKAVNQYLDKKISKIVNRELELALASTGEGNAVFLLNENQLVKPMPKIPKSSRCVTPEPLSGISKEFAIFFDDSQNIITQKEHCRQICQSLLRDSSQFKLPSKCLNHIVEQILEVDTYLRNMTVSEFICDKINHIPHEMRNQLMKIDYPHFVHPIPNVKCRDGKWLIEKFKGFHWDYKNTLEEHGEVSYKIIEELSNGCRHVEIKVAGMLDGTRKTMFSSDRLLIDVVKDFREAANAADVFKIDPLTKTITIEGFSKNGTKISGFINKDGTVPTFYPYLKKN